MQASRSVQASGELVDLRAYVEVLRRRALLIVIPTIFGLVLSLGYSLNQTPIYTATAKVLINPPTGSTSQNPNNLISVDTEAQVAASAPIAGAVAKTLGAPLTITQVLNRVSVTTTLDTFVLAISYSDAEPAQAALGANAFAKAYLDFKTQQTQDQVSQQQASIESQLAELQRGQRQQNRILGKNPPGTVEYRNAQDALSQISVRLALLASSLAQLPQIVEPGQIILPAAVPKAPSSPTIPLNAAFGLFLGLLCGVVAALVLNRMDDRVYDEADLQAYLDVPLLATVPHVKGRHRQRVANLLMHLEPRSPAAEAYRSIRTNVASMAQKRHLKVFAFVSPVQGEGKSMTCANVAAALGQTDNRVLVLSADMRNPTIHEFFFASNKPGLGEVLEGKISFGEAVKKTVGNVWVLSGGDFPPSPVELLQSPEMADLLLAVRQEFDFVLIDCPPVLGLADCLAVLPLVDAVLLVAKAGRTHVGAIVEARDRLERVGVSIEAIIINDIQVRRGQPGHEAYGYYRTSQEDLSPEPEESAEARSLAQQPPKTTIPDGNGSTPGMEEGRTWTGDEGNRIRRGGRARKGRANQPVTAGSEPSTSSADET